MAHKSYNAAQSKIPHTSRHSLVASSVLGARSAL